MGEGSSNPWSSIKSRSCGSPVVGPSVTNHPLSRITLRGHRFQTSLNTKFERMLILGEDRIERHHGIPFAGSDGRKGP